MAIASADSRYEHSFRTVFRFFFKLTTKLDDVEYKELP